MKISRNPKEPAAEMPLKTPAFWYRSADRPTTATEIALTPFSWIYDAGRKIRNSGIKTEKANIPVLCVGNIVSGGSGKTPAVRALRELLRANNLSKTPFILSRGYGGTLPGPVLVDHDTHRFSEVGDEPLLLAKEGQVIISRNRPEGAKIAERFGADLILMDDGFQNPSLKKNVSFLVIDGSSGLGNGKLLPAGPLREPLNEALERTDAAILIGEDERGIKNKIPAHIPVFGASIKPHLTPDPHKNYIGFAGLGRPEKFKKTLEDCGLKLTAFYAFADHHPYTDGDMQKLLQEANLKKAVLITTEKDWVRISEIRRSQIQTLPIALEWSAPERLTDFLSNALENITSKKARAP